MKIHPQTHADPLNQPKQTSALKPLADSDFAGQLNAIANEDGGAGPAPSRSALRPLSPIEMVPGVKGPIGPLKPLEPPVPPLAPLGEGDATFHAGNPKQPKSE